MIEVSTSRSAPHRELFSLLHWLALATLGTAQLLLLILAFIFFARTAGGSVAGTLPGGMLFGAALVLIAVGAAFRAVVMPRMMPAGALSAARPVLGWQLALMSAPTLTLLLMLIPCTLAWHSLAWLLLTWLVAIAFETASWSLLLRPVSGVSTLAGARTNVVRSLHRAEVPRVEEPAERPDGGEAAEPEAANFEAECLAPDVIQKLTRTRDAEGAETISALVRIAFPPGDPLQVVHLSFCPPLARSPAIELEPLDGPEIELRVTVAQTYGTRFEARLAEPASDERSAVVQLYASTTIECEPESEA
jgi:hypothetical protein